MFLGPKRTGKGTLTRVIESVIGESDCSHVSLQDLADHRFARARLFGMKLNTYADLPADPIKDPGIFKNLTGEDTIDAENKFEQIFCFKNRAKLLYSANQLPKLRRDDDAFYSRWIIVPFNNSVYGNEDVHLKAKLTTPEELSGILNFGLEGLARLRSNGWRFTYEDDAAGIYRRKSNPIIAFLEDKCEQSDGYVSKADLIAAYNEYARNERLPLAPSKKAFGGMMMDQMVIPVETTNPNVNGRQVESWSGIKLKETA
jgi:putative DNA primase/helicase